MKFIVMHHTITCTTCKSFYLNFDICLTTFYWFLHVFATANQNLGTVKEQDVKFSNSPFTLMGVLKVLETSGELLQFDWPFKRKEDESRFPRCFA